MFDVNDHPQQDALNQEFGKVLSNTVTSLDSLSGTYSISLKDAIIQYLDSFVVYINRYQKIDAKIIKHEVRKALFVHDLVYKIKSFFGIKE